VPIQLYLDTNVLCRPFDDQRISRVRLETDAFERILEKVRQDEATLISSEILLFEIQRIIQPGKRAKASVYLRMARAYHAMTDKTLTLARRITERFKLQPRDALHAASALLEGSEYFLTCDDGITKRFKRRSLSATIDETQRRILDVMNPVAFVETVQW
jgi:predicted nucleic acid-binding protein